MDRYLVNTSATLTATFYTGRTATDPSPDTATVTITRGDGTALVTNASANNADTGVFSYTISASLNTQLDSLTAVWSATIGGQAQTIKTKAEIVGGFVFGLAQFAARPDVASGTYTDQQLADARTLAEQAIEHELDYALVPRYARETLNGSASQTLTLSKPKIRTVRTITVAGTALDVSQLANVDLFGYGSLFSPDRWSLGYGNIVVEYEHGEDAPEAPLQRAALILAQDRLVNGPMGSELQKAIGDGATIPLAVPGMRGSRFGLPEVDAVVDEYSLKMPGIA